MVFKDTVGTKQAQIELAESEKQLLLTLKNKNPNKSIASPVVPSHYDLGLSQANIMSAPYMLPFDIEMGGPAPGHQKYNPQQMHCLKKLLEQEYPVDDGQEHDDEDVNKCKCMNEQPEFLENAVSKYIQEQYQKYLAKKKAHKAELIAQGHTGLNFNDCDHVVDLYSDDEIDGMMQFNINII